MRWLLWAAAGVLLAVAAAAVWFAFQRPDFVAGLALAAAGALGKALAGAVGGQIARDMADPEVDRRTKESARNPEGHVPKGLGVTTGKTITQPAATRRNRPKP